MSSDHNNVTKNAVELPSLTNKERVLGDQYVTEEEMEHFNNVCRRYELFQSQENERIKVINEKSIFSERTRFTMLNHDAAHCAFCGAVFVFFLNPKSVCHHCQQCVCRTCVHSNADSDGIICKACFNECSIKAKTGLWFMEKLQVAKKDGRIIEMAPISALQASLERKRREQSGPLTDHIEKDKSQMTPNSSARSSIRLRAENNLPVTELRRRLSSASSTAANIQDKPIEALPPEDDKSQMDPYLSPRSSVHSRTGSSPQVTELRRRLSSTSSVTSSFRSGFHTPLDGRRRSLQSALAKKPPHPLSPVKGVEQPNPNVTISGSNECPTRRSRQHSNSGYSTPNASISNPANIADGNRCDNRSATSRGSVGSVTSVYSEREESFTHGIMITGDLQFSVDYDQKTSLLRVFVIKAREVAIADKKTNDSSTYVKTYLLPDKTKQSKRKTMVKKHTNNPVFNEELTYNIVEEDLSHRTLQLAVWHHRHMKANLFLGEVILPLVDCLFGSVKIWRALQDKCSSDAQSDRKLAKGQVRLALKFLPLSQGDMGELHVCIKNATDLSIPTDALSQSDEKNTVNPFVKIHLLPERQRTSKRKTKVVKKTNNPIWEETIVYKGIAKTQLPSIGLQIIVWSTNKLGRSDYLGGCNLNTGSKSAYGMDATGTERAIWVEMMSKPNTMVEGNVQLRLTMG